MTHIDNYLKENEKIIYRTGTHWVILGAPALLLFLAGVSISTHGTSSTVLFVIAVMWIILSYVIYQHTEFAVTNSRLLIRTIFPWKNFKEVGLTEVANTGLYQPTLGKFLNFGKITIGLANGRHLTHRMVNSPYLFLMTLQQQAEAVRGMQQDSSTENK